MANNYTVRDEDDEIVAAFDSEAKALEYGSRLADANPEKLYAVYGVVPIVPRGRRRTHGRVTKRPEGER